jgi:hypothetical protein
MYNENKILEADYYKTNTYTNNYTNSYTNTYIEGGKGNGNANAVGAVNLFLENTKKNNKKSKKEINTHTLIDYSLNNTNLKSNKYFSPKNKLTKLTFESAVKNTVDDIRKSNEVFSNNKKNKINIYDKKIKTILEKSKERGKFLSPYFSLCNHCNERNNDFYNKINVKIAYGILNTLDKDNSKQKYK